MYTYNRRVREKKARSRISKKAILIAVLIWSAYYIIQHLMGTLFVPDGFSADFYRGGVKTFYAIENSIDDKKSLGKEEQEWIKKYVYGDQELSEKEQRAARAFKDYLYASILGPRDKIKEEPEWASAYEKARSRVRESLELED